MGAWNFEKQFAGKVESGVKQTTIRKCRKDGRNPIVGEKMSLFTGMRRKVCRRLGEAIIERRATIQISKGRMIFDGKRLTASNMYAIIKADGFKYATDFFDFFDDGDFEGYWYWFRLIKKGADNER